MVCVCVCLILINILCFQDYHPDLPPTQGSWVPLLSLARKPMFILKSVRRSWFQFLGDQLFHLVGWYPFFKAPVSSYIL